MKIYNLIKIKEVFAPHYNEKLSAGLSYKIYKLCNSIEQDEKFFEVKRNAIIQEFGERDESGNIVVNDQGFVKIQEDKLEVAQEQINALTDVEVDTPSVTFALKELSEIKLSVADMAVLDMLIKED